MKIVHIIPGSGGSFYCGNCLRDSKYVRALKDLGHQVIKVPLYLPIFDDAHDLDEVPVFYGAVNLYLKQQFPIFRHMPSFVEHALDSKSILEMAARKAGSTRAKGLEEMTISMLLGEEGNQKEELERLVGFLVDICDGDGGHDMLLVDQFLGDLHAALVLGLVVAFDQQQLAAHHAAGLVDFFFGLLEAELGVGAERAEKAGQRREMADLDLVGGGVEGGRLCLGRWECPRGRVAGVRAARGSRSAVGLGRLAHRAGLGRSRAGLYRPFGGRI